MKIKDIKPGMKNLEVVAYVARKWETERSRWRRHALTMLTDDTGRIRLNLWREQVDQIKVGDQVHLVASFARRYRGSVLELSTWEERIRVNRHLRMPPRYASSALALDAAEETRTNRRKAWTFP